MVMPEFSEASLLSFFAEYAYEPGHVYGLIIIFMLASSFGFPIPEELVLISAGLVAHMAKDPVRYPPPYEGALGVDVFTLATICFLAVFLSDLLVYLIGKVFGGKILRSRFFEKRAKGDFFSKVTDWFQKYGAWAAGIFRFTPGLRFTGHLSCGLLGLPLWKFVLVDGLAALLSVPTQVYLVAEYGDVVLSKLKEFKISLFIVIFLIICAYALRRVIQKNKVSRDH